MLFIVYYFKVSIMTLLLLALVTLLIALVVAYKYYFKPKAEIRRYAALFRSLGYTVYQYPFSFMGLGFSQIEQMGVKMHRDAQHLQKTVIPQVDVAISNSVDKVVIFLVNPDLIRQFYSCNTPYKYPKLPTLIAGFKLVLGQGIVFSEGETWKRKRKLLSKVFNFQLIMENIPKMVEICNKCFDLYEEKHMVSEGVLKINTFKLSAGIFNGVMMKCFFGNDCINHTIGDGKNYPQFVMETVAEAADLTLTPLIIFFGEFAWKIGLTPKIRQLNQRITLMRTKADQIIKERTEQVLNSPQKQKPTDIIQALINERLNNKQQHTYTHNEIIDEFQTFVVAGTDTTTRFFTMMIFALGNHPEIHKRVREQINAVIKSDEDITYENLKKLTYIDWIQNETTRMYGPSNGILFRVATEDNYLKDVQVTKGTLVTTQHFGCHYSPKYFKDPFDFRPERWEKQCNGLHPFAFVGFSAGIRTCLGKHLAYIQSKVALIKLMKRYESIEVPKEVTMLLKFMYESEPFDTVLIKSTVRL